MNGNNEDDYGMVDIVKGLRGIPDRGEPCDHEIDNDGTQITLNNESDDETQNC